MRASIAACVVACAHAASFFVSSSNPAASDTNAGTSSTLPWKTLQHVAAMVPSMSAGDAVLLRNGDEWILTESLNFTAWPAAGGITFASYADAGQADRPLIARNVSVNAAGATIVFFNPVGITLDGLHVSGGEQNVVFFYTAVGTYSSITVVDCELEKANGVAYDPSSGDWWGTSLAIAANQAGVTVTNVNISHNIVHDVDTAYNNRVNWHGSATVYVSGIVVEANTITRASYNTIMMGITDSFSVLRNVFLRNTPLRLFTAGTTDIIIGALNSSCEIVGNEIAYRGEFPTGPDGCAIDFETSAVGMRVRGNYIHHSWGAGVMIFGHTTTSHDITIDSNIILFDGCNQTRNDSGCIAFMRPNSSGTMSNNLFATCPGVPVFHESRPGTSAGWKFINNTIDSPNTPVVPADAPTVTAAASPAGGIRISASSAQLGATLVYTTDGSRPTAGSTPFPAVGYVDLPARGVAVNVKSFVTGLVESSVAGGVFSPARKRSADS